MSLPVKEFWKFVNIWGSYGQEFVVLFFWDSVHTSFKKHSKTLFFHCPFSLWLFKAQLNVVIIMRVFAVFTARRYASAVYAVVMCPSVCLSVSPSQAGVVSKRMDESSWFWRLPFTYLTFYYKEIYVSSKTSVLPSKTLSQTPDLENFATLSSTVELVGDPYTKIDESWLFTTS